MRRGPAWSAAVLGSMAVSIALIAATAPATPEAQPRLVTGPQWRAAATGEASPAYRSGLAADTAWLSSGSVPGKNTRWEKMGRTALLDLHRLSLGTGAVAGGAGGNWNYAWPRDAAFVAVALSRTGHQGDAVELLSFLERVQLDDGGFESRYRLDGSGPPDGRPSQSDGAGWVLWALSEVSRGPGRVVARSAQLRSLLDEATGFALNVTADGRRLPPASPDYWEMPVSRTTLGTVGPLLAGLEASQRMYAALGERALAQRSGAAVSRLRTVVKVRFGDDYQRFGSQWLRDGGGLDAAVTFFMPPFRQSASPGVVQAWTRYQAESLRPAGGLAPGSRWKQDGISWTPETALVAYTAATSRRPAISAHWMDWLSDHRTPWGSVPEKVLANGAPAGPAPLAWTAALVVLTLDELETGSGSRAHP